MNKNKSKNKSYPCIKCGWAMGEKEGKPICDHCKNTKGDKNNDQS